MQLFKKDILRKPLFLLLLLSVAGFTALAQEPGKSYHIKLKSGETIQGKLLVKTEIALTIETAKRERFQFSLADIEQWSEDFNLQQEQKKPSQKQTSSFAIRTELNAGVVRVERVALSTTPMASLRLSLGSDHVFGMPVYLGVGTGFKRIFREGINETVDFVPVYLDMQVPLWQGKTQPYVAGKLGYNFSAKGNWSGGVLSELGAGLRFGFTEKVALHVGVFGSVEQILGTVIEQNRWGEFVSEGRASLHGSGLSISLIF